MQPQLRRISDYIYVTGQLQPEDMKALAQEGFTVLVNHRPDGEEAGQPTALEMARQAEQAGMASVHAPVQGLPDEAAVALTRLTLDGLGSGEKVVMFCRSGMRSTCAWALAERLNGAEPEALRAAAMDAGYDLSRVPL